MKKNLNKKQTLIFKIILVISWTIISFFITINKNPKIIVENSIIVLITLLIIIKRLRIPNIERKKLFVAIPISCYVDRLFLSIFEERVLMFQDLIISKTNIESIRFIFYSMIAIAIFPTILFCIYSFIEKVLPTIRKELKTINNIEKKYLIVTTIVSAILVIGISLLTSAFQVSTYDNVSQSYDVIYTSDNGYLSRNDAWTNLENPENDIRQPLFAVFSLPISIPCHIISEFLFFIPKEISYLTLMTIIQFILLSITTILIARLMNVEDTNKKYIYCIFSLSFPYILFGLVLEQYVIGLFYLILTIYYFYQNKKKINYLYIGAVGTLLTSGIIFPFITKINNLKDWIKKIFKCFLVFIASLILSGQFAQIFTLKQKMINMGNYTGKEITFIEKISQFTNFVQSLFLTPKGKIGKNIYDVISYQLIPVKSISIIGIIILIVLFISFVINRKEKMGLISFSWILFSFLILCVIGWGTKENGLILYSIYFSWAYYSLYYMLLNKIKNKKIFKVLIAITIVIMLFSTTIEMYNILKFAIKYYPR